MSPDASQDALLAVVDDLGRVAGAGDIDTLLRAAVETACRATGAECGLAGLFDGDSAESREWYDLRGGWTPARLRFARVEGGAGRACASAKPLLHSNIAGKVSAFPKATEVLHVRSLACTPLLSATGAVLGFLEVGARERDLTSGDERLLDALARVAAARLGDLAQDGRREARLRAAQVEIAERLQQRLLPSAPPAVLGLDIAFAYASASAGVLSGGDFVDYYARPPSTSLTFAIGDVAGKGVDAMAITFVTKYMLRAAVHGGLLSWPTNPGEALQELHTGLLEQPDFGPDSERFVTALFGQISARRGLVQLASAGHPAPFIVRAAGVEQPLLPTEPAIGVVLGAALAPYPVETLQLARGDLVLLFTDGVGELRDASGDFFEDKMPSLLASRHGAPAKKVVEDVMAAGLAFSARPPGDDRALLCLGLTMDPEVD